MVLYVAEAIAAAAAVAIAAGAPARAPLGTVDNRRCVLQQSLHGHTANTFPVLGVYKCGALKCFYPHPHEDKTLKNIAVVAIAAAATAAVAVSTAV